MQNKKQKIDIKGLRILAREIRDYTHLERSNDISLDKEFHGKYGERKSNLESISCGFAYFPMIEFEFTRGAYELEHKQKRKKFIEKLALFRTSFSGYRYQKCN